MIFLSNHLQNISCVEGLGYDSLLLFSVLCNYKLNILKKKF